MPHQGYDFEELMTRVKIAGSPQFGRLQVVDLKSPDASGNLDYLTLDNALAESLIDITEINEGGSVPFLKLTNRAHRMVFLMAGELLVGCKQDRVLNTSLMVAARSEMRIPVTCVEAGRWRYRSSTFRSGGSSSHSYLRRAMLGQTHAHYRQSGMPGSDQHAVWQEVDRKIGEMQSSSASSALDTVYQSYSKSLDAVVEQLPSVEGCEGVVFAIDGEIIGLDLFDQATTLTKLWPKLVKSYAIDALGSSTKESASLPKPDDVIEWLRSFSQAKREQFQSPGVSIDIRMKSDEMVGAALVVDEQPVHVACFHESGDQQPRS
jgi:hypothetical protein